MKQLPSTVSVTSDVKQTLNEQVEITFYDEGKIEMKAALRAGFTPEYSPPSSILVTW